MSVHELLNPRVRVHPQPEPRIFPGGDCGACVLGGLLGIGVQEAYDFVGRRARENEARARHWPEPFTVQDMIGALVDAEHAGFLDRVNVSRPMWLYEIPHEQSSFGPIGARQVRGWVSYLTMALDAGYVAVARMDTEARGSGPAETDHWVLINGIRTRWEDHPTVAGARCGIEEIHVLNSSAKLPLESWMDVHDFLRDRGGFDLLLARKAPSGWSVAE